MSIVSFIMGLLLVGLGIFAIFDGWYDADGFEIGGGIAVLLFGIFVILISFSLAKSERVNPIEYPTSEYTLELKVIEYQGQKDTTYVITPRKHTKP